MSASLSVDLDGDELIINWRCLSQNRWYEVLEDFKTYFGYDAHFDGDRRRWILPRSEYMALRAWARRHFQPGQIRDSAAGKKQHKTSCPPAKPGPIEQAYRALYLVPGAPAWAITAMYRAAAKEYHPDAAGDHELMVRLNAAVALLRQVAS